jgi:hypothetical protein
MTLLIKEAERRVSDRQRAAEKAKAERERAERIADTLTKIAKRGSIKGYRRPAWWQRFLKAGRRLVR